MVGLFSLVTASHGVFDAMTNGGLGIAFFSPFDNGRYFFPWTPIDVSPIGVRGFFSQRGLDILISETIYVVIPLLLLWAVIALLKRAKTRAISN
jgi:inner membrane protein